MNPANKIDDAIGPQGRAFLQRRLWPGTGLHWSGTWRGDNMRRVFIASATLLGFAAVTASALAAGNYTVMNQGSAMRAPPDNSGGMAPGAVINAPPGVDPMIWQAITTGRTSAYGLPPQYWQEIVGGSGGGGS